MENDKISLIGLGKLGLCLAAIYASKGTDVIGIDISRKVVSSINEGKSPIVETGLDKLIALTGGKSLLATMDASRAINETDISIILTNTPSLPDGSFSNEQIIAVLTALSKAFADSKKPYHLFVISSTVVPGSIENSFIPLIESISGKKLDKDFGICYDPDFVALGDVINGFCKPDIVIIGQSDEKAGVILKALHSRILENKPPIHVMSLASAQVAKVCLNAYITTKISFANLIGDICVKVQGADPDDITTALGGDKRISPYYFHAGLSYGGTCFPRDTWALTHILKSLGLSPAIMEACEEINNYQDRKLAQNTLAAAEELSADTIGILGLAFKNGTPVIVQSPAIKLIKALLEQNKKVVVYDPLAMENTKEIFGDQIVYVESVQDCMKKSPLCVLTLASREMTQQIHAYSDSKPCLVLDPWRILGKRKESYNLEIRRI